MIVKGLEGLTDKEKAEKMGFPLALAFTMLSTIEDETEKVAVICAILENLNDIDSDALKIALVMTMDEVLGIKNKEKEEED